MVGVKIRENLEISCCDRKQEHAQRLTRVCRKDIEIGLYWFSLANEGQFEHQNEYQWFQIITHSIKWDTKNS